jgi:hypothetical protein
MVVFTFSPKITPFQYAFVALHGLTDLRHPMRIAPYIFVAAPLGGHRLTAMFFVASLVHFSTDVGIAGSILLHGLLWRFYNNNMKTQALEFVLFYMIFLHTPMHYVCVLSENTQQAHLSAAFALCITCGASILFKSVYVQSVSITHLAQRLIIAHVVSTQLCTT